ncbi:MAG: 16S rRNA (cytosine(967)-C(5))-methyltransferase RsmB [Acidobacteriota bacterium]
MSVSPARRFAFKILLQSATSDLQISDALHSPQCEALELRDRRLSAELAYGVARNQSLLDGYLSRFLRTPFARLDLPVAVSLRLAAYQLLFLDRVPARAAVHESVSLVRAAGYHSASGMVNAVLRKVTRRDFATTLAGLELNDVAGLSLRYSHPEWLVGRWVRRFGLALAKATLEQNNQKPRHYFRLSCPLAESKAVLESLTSVEIEPHPSVEGAWSATRGDITATPAFQMHRIYQQDPASQWAAHLLDPGNARLCLDLCAAPGGKASLLARLGRGKIRIVAVDRVRRRLSTARNLHGQLWPSLLFVAADGTQPLPFNRVFDRVLIDAPCSGTGTVGRNPEIRWRLAEKRLQAYQNRQLQLLNRAAQALVAGGRLVYSTCSLEREENEQVIERFLTLHREFSVAIPDASAFASVVASSQGVTLLPSSQNNDGFFATILVRNR